jgi:hypothetical protein
MTWTKLNLENNLKKYGVDKFVCMNHINYSWKLQTKNINCWEHILSNQSCYRSIQRLTIRSPRMYEGPACTYVTGSTWLLGMWGGLVSQDQVISYTDAMRSNPLITACTHGIFPAITGEHNTFWNRAITVPQYEAELLKGLRTARDCTWSITTSTSQQLYSAMPCFFGSIHSRQPQLKVTKPRNQRPRVSRKTFCCSLKWNIYRNSVKGKAIPLQAWTGP